MKRTDGISTAASQWPHYLRTTAITNYREHTVTVFNQGGYSSIFKYIFVMVSANP